jgi:hypothetical protein
MSCTKSMYVRARQARAEPAGFAPYGDFGTARQPAHPARFARALAGSAASREGMGTLPGFPSTMSSPPPFHESETVCLRTPVGAPNPRE